MTEDELENVMRAIAARRQQERTHTRGTPSKEILAVIQSLADGGKVREIAEAFNLYIAAHGQTRAFLSAKIPPLVLSHCVFRTAGVRVENFENWVVSHPDWAEGLKQSLRSPDAFERCVQLLIEAVKHA